MIRAARVPVNGKCPFPHAYNRDSEAVEGGCLAVLPARAGIGRETGGADLGEPVIELATEGELVITPGPMKVEIEVARNKHRVVPGGVAGKIT